MRPRYYMQLIDKSPEDISSGWRYLHVIISIGLIVSGFIGAKMATAIFRVYDFRCVLYAKIIYRTPQQSIFYYHMLQDIQREIDNETGIVSELLVEDDDIHQSHILPNYVGDKIGRIKIDNIEVDIHYLISNETGFEVQPRLHLYNNGTHQYVGEMRLRRTVFATSLMCDYTMTIPLISLVIAAVFGVFTFFQGKTFDIPGMNMCSSILLIASLVMMLFVGIASMVFKNGLEAFCSRYILFSGVKHCSYAMDEFTLQFVTEEFPYYNSYRAGKYAYYVTFWLWAFQACLLVLRILCITDFDVVLTRIKKKDKNDEDEKGAQMETIVAKAMKEMRRRKTQDDSPSVVKI